MLNEENVGKFKKKKKGNHQVAKRNATNFFDNFRNMSYNMISETDGEHGITKKFTISPPL